MNIRVRVEEVLPNVDQFTFKTQYEACATFMRLQEFYESKFRDIKGKYFTLEHFMDRYARDTGNFTYTSDWGGFNIPGHVAKHFFSTFKSNILLEKELRLKELLKHRLKTNEPFYIIALYGDTPNEQYLNHEICHALYYLNKDYKLETDKLVRKLPKDIKRIMVAWLKDNGYVRSVITDEINAYLSTSSEGSLRGWFGGQVADGYKLYESLRISYRFHRTLRYFNLH
jgi:hypothetical protein